MGQDCFLAMLESGLCEWLYKESQTRLSHFLEFGIWNFWIDNWARLISSLCSEIGLKGETY